MSRRDLQTFKDTMAQDEIAQAVHQVGQIKTTEVIASVALRELNNLERSLRDAFENYQVLLRAESRARKLARSVLQVLFSSKGQWGAEVDDRLEEIMKKFRLESERARKGKPPYDDSLGPTDPKRTSRSPIEVLPKHRRTVAQRIPIDEDIGPFTFTSRRPQCQDQGRYTGAFQPNHVAFPRETRTSTNDGYYAERNMHHESQTPYTSTNRQRLSDRPESVGRPSTHLNPQDWGSNWSLEAACDGPNPSLYHTNDESGEARWRELSSNEPHGIAYGSESPGENARPNFPGFNESYNHEDEFHLQYSHQVRHGESPSEAVFQYGSSSQSNNQPYYTSSYRGRTQ